MNPKGIAEALGADVLAALYKCFVGIDRIMTFEHLIYISQVEYAEKNGGRDTPSAERNMHVLFLLLAGTLYELGDALQQLTSAKCALKLSDRSVWNPVNELRKKWHKDPMGAKIRNGFSHHLGDIDDFKRGIEDGPAEVELIRGHTELRYGARFIEPWDALFRAAAFDFAEYEAFARRTKEDHEALPEHMVELLSELLTANGIDVVDERRAS